MSCLTTPSWVGISAIAKSISTSTEPTSSSNGKGLAAGMSVGADVAGTLNTKTLRRLSRGRGGLLGFVFDRLGGFCCCVGSTWRGELETRCSPPLLGQLCSSSSLGEGKRMTSSMSATRWTTTAALVGVLATLVSLGLVSLTLVFTVCSTGRRSGRGSHVGNARHRGLVTTVGGLARGVYPATHLLWELESVARHGGLTLNRRRVSMQLLLLLLLLLLLRQHA